MAKKQQDEVKKGLPPWMGTYGDMVTLLLCFFVLLFSMSSVDVRKFKEAISSFNDRAYILTGGETILEGDSINNGVKQVSDIEMLIDRAVARNTKGEDSKSDGSSIKPGDESGLKKAEELYKKMNSYLKEEGVKEAVTVNYSSNYIKITLPGEALFDPGEAKIKSIGYDIIDKISFILKKQEFAEYSIHIEGHTDDVPINTRYFPSNWELSAARAIAVGKYIIETKNINENKIACTGYGEYKPIVPNNSPENRAKNRRVEVKLVLKSREISIDEYGE